MLTHCIRLCACPWLMSMYKNHIAFVQRNMNCFSLMLLCRSTLPTECLRFVADTAYVTKHYGHHMHCPMLPSCADAVTLDQESFCQAVAVVVAHAAYLPSVECFALLPIASTLARTGAETGAALDYDIDNACVTLTAQRTVRYSCLCPMSYAVHVAVDTKATCPVCSAVSSNLQVLWLLYATWTASRQSSPLLTCAEVDRHLRSLCNSGATAASVGRVVSTCSGQQPHLQPYKLCA